MRLISPAAALAALSVFAALPAPAAERLGRTVSKPRAGYAVKILEGWAEVPIQPGEEVMVGQFLPERDTLRAARFDVYRWDRKPAIVPEKPTVLGEKKPDVEEKKSTGEPFDLESLIRSRDMKPGEPTPIEGGSEGLRGDYFEIEGPWGMTLAVRFRSARHEFGLVYRAPSREYEKDFRSAFLKSARTFRLLSIDSGRAIGDIAGLSDRELLRREKHEQIEGIPGWYSVDTENYVILSNSDDKALVRRLASQIEKVRVLYQDLFPPARAVTAISTVRVCKSQQEYHKYGGPPGTGGYWNDEAEELVFYNRAPNQSKRQAKKNSLSVLYHEAFHQYIYYAIGEVAPHSWYNEGHGDYFAGAVPVGDKFQIGPFDWRVPVVRRLVAEGQLVPLKKFVYFSQAEYYRNARNNYAQGWAFIYFLRKVTKNPDWKKIPDVYFAYLKSHLNAEDTTTPNPSAPPPSGDVAPPAPAGPASPGDPEVPKEPVPPPPDDGPAPPSDGAPPPPGGEGGEEDEDELPPPPDPKQAESIEEQKILKAAVDRAFEGVDWEALEREFRAFLKRV